MPLERRKGEPAPTSSPLPQDYLKMVTEVFTTNFDAGLQALKPLMKGAPSFEVSGAVHSDELILAVTLVEEDQIAATTVYASVDFDPKASAPTIQDLLSVCVDAIGSAYSHILSTDNPDRLEQVASHALSVMDNVPFHWTEMKVDRYRIYIKLDKANPKLDRIADEWLSKNDPELKELAAKNEEDAKGLFVTGPSDRRPGGKGGSGHVH
jgi:hypothetical protein